MVKKYQAIRKRFPTFEFFFQNYAIEIGGLPMFICHFFDCNYQTRHSSNIESHIKSHAPIYECKICFQSFYTRTEKDNCEALHNSGKNWIKNLND